MIGSANSAFIFSLAQSHTDTTSKRVVAASSLSCWFFCAGPKAKSGDQGMFARNSLWHILYTCMLCAPIPPSVFWWSLVWHGAQSPPIWGNSKTTSRVQAFKAHGPWSAWWPTSMLRLQWHSRSLAKVSCQQTVGCLLLHIALGPKILFPGAPGALLPVKGYIVSNETNVTHATLNSHLIIRDGSDHNGHGAIHPSPLVIEASGYKAGPSNKGYNVLLEQRLGQETDCKALLWFQYWCDVLLQCTSCCSCWPQYQAGPSTLCFGQVWPAVFPTPAQQISQQSSPMRLDSASPM